MKKIGIYIVIFILVIMFRDNISFFYGNVLGVFKLDNNYYESIIDLKNDKIKYLENEIKSLNEFSSKLDMINYSYKVSKITYKESLDTNKYIIQYGKKDGVTVGNGVTNEYGLIGKVTKLGKHTSELTSIRDLKDISVIVNNSYGKLNYDYKNNTFIISDISNYDVVHINDEVYTSGYGTIREKLYIGKIVKIENKDFKKVLYMKSNVYFNNLNYVLIVGDFK